MAHAAMVQSVVNRWIVSFRNEVIPALATVRGDGLAQPNRNGSSLPGNSHHAGHRHVLARLRRRSKWTLSASELAT